MFKKAFKMYIELNQQVLQTLLGPLHLTVRGGLIPSHLKQLSNFTYNHNFQY